MLETTYLALAITGFFTGLGVITAQAIFEFWIKPYIKKLHKTSTRLRKRIGINRIFAWGYARFLIVGVVGTLISMAILYTLTEYFHLYYLLSFIIGTIAGSINNYLWSKYWVFKS